DVPLPRAAHARSRAGDSRTCVRGDARIRLYARRRVPLPAPRHRRLALRTARRDVMAHRGGSEVDRHRADLAARVLRPFGLRWTATAARPETLDPRHRWLLRAAR